MRTRIFAIVLLGALALGCTASQPQAPTAAQELGVSKSYYHYDDFMDNYPVVGGCVFCCYLVLMGVASACAGMAH